MKEWIVLSLSLSLSLAAPAICILKITPPRATRRFVIVMTPGTDLH